MPGIAGIVRRKPNEEVWRDVGLMVEAMRHKPYYESNQYANERLGLYVGWTSHPGSGAKCMPLTSHNKQVAVIISGEIVTHPPCSFPPERNGNLNGGAGNLIHLLEESEDRLLGELNGWFSGVAVNEIHQRITLFNDRYGMGRIYFYQGEDEFLFASEAKSLLRVRPGLRAIAPEALAQYLCFHCVMGDKTLYQGISLLPGGSSWVFAGSAVPQRKRYFDFAQWEDQPSLKPHDFYEKFEETVSRVFPAYMEGPSGVGLSLTAGLDTRAILASTRQQTRSLPCYTFGGPWGDTFDIQTARQLAAICHQPHDVIRIDDRFLQEFPGYAKRSVHVSDGNHDAFGAHDVYFNEIARDLAPIRLTGKFGSEVVGAKDLIPSGGFPRRFVQPGFVPFLDHVASFDRLSKRRHPISKVVSEEIPWYEFGRVAVEQSELPQRTPYMDNELVKLMYQAPHRDRASRALQARYIQEKGEQISRIPTNLGMLGRHGKIVSKMMYFPLWALFKVEFIYLFATPHWLTWVDRKIEKAKPERVLAGRQKFEGYRIWIRTHLKECVQDMLLNPNARCTEFFDKASVAKVVRRHIQGSHNYLNEINKMLTLELIYTSLLAPESSYQDSSGTLLAAH